ncbi:MAG TPA: cupin domain-containing protein [Gaiellaceae bacterium]|nr:cupin domain-containing protein [Gaiellaceae bacterium]
MNLFDDAPGRFGERLGAKLWGGTLYELAPGDASKYHWQVGEEEWLVVIVGHPTLRTPDGERTLEPWDTVACVRGEAGAHQLKNETDEPVRVVWCSTVSDPEVVVYPDEDRVGVVANWSRDELPTIRGWVEMP